MERIGPSLAPLARPMRISRKMRTMSQRSVPLAVMAPLEKRWISFIASFPPLRLPKITRPDSAPRSMAR